jgi:hypothetical protein
MEKLSQHTNVSGPSQAAGTQHEGDTNSLSHSPLLSRSAVNDPARGSARYGRPSCGPV